MGMPVCAFFLLKAKQSIMNTIAILEVMVFLVNSPSIYLALVLSYA